MEGLRLFGGGEDAVTLNIKTLLHVNAAANHVT